MAIKKEENILKYKVKDIREAGSLFGYSSDIVNGAFFSVDGDKEFTEKEAESIIKAYANKEIK